MSTLNAKDNIAKLFSRVDDLKTLPAVVLQINNLLRKEAVSIEEVSNTIEKDAALTARVLKLSNSSYYGLSYKVNSPASAIAILGFDTIRNLAVTISLTKSFNKPGKSAFNVKEVWLHGLGCAVAAKALACKSRDLGLQEKAFIGGIIHDIGKLLIFENMPAEMDRIMEMSSFDRTVDYGEIEKDVLGFTHADVGAYVAEKWLFPPELTGTIKYHHRPELNKEDREIACAVHAGNEIAKALCLGKSTFEKARNMNPRIWKELDLTEDDLSGIIPQIKMDFDVILNSLNLA
ncbi:MAG: HDOD domain-containing protein [Nitrospirota bacterium]|nr:HDOD domain-containing protein [Nitrospirota bacterium]